MNNVDKEHYLINLLSSKYIGDDAAVIGNMLYSMDAFFEDVHFKREWMTPEQIARKAMLVNISDAVAMNAQPLYALVTLSLPKDITEQKMNALTQSLESTAAEYGCEIIGGDTIGADKLHLSITIVSQSDAPLLRTGIEEGDLLAYTGALGESGRDLKRLFSGEQIEPGSKFFEPKLRASFVKEAREHLHAGMDISDGLYCDTNKLLDINAFGMEVLIQIDAETGDSGEEYEMLVAFDKKNLNTLETIAKKYGTTLTVFARVAQNQKRFPCKSQHF